MTILWDSDPTSVERYSLAVGDGAALADAPAAVSRLLEASPTEQLVIIGPGVDLAAACQTSESLRVDRPDVGVVLLRTRVDVAVLGQALQAGVRAVVGAGELSQLADACRRSRELSGRLQSGSTGSNRQVLGRVVTVFSAKGGVGKTTFSTNIGAYLASLGYRTLVVDLDLAFGDVGISLQIVPQQTMQDVSAMAGSLDEQALRQVVTRHPCGLEVLCAPSLPAEADRIAGSTVSEVLRVARRDYDFVVVDTPPAFTDHVLASFDLSDVILLIVTPDIPALKNIRLTLDTLDLLGIPREMRAIVLNRSDAKVGLTSKDVVTAIRQDIAVMVPGSVDVPASTNRGTVIVLEEPRHPVSLALRDLVDRHVVAPFSPIESRSDAPRPVVAARRFMSWGRSS
ncbi:MAG: AAA family ATPase [Actinomycetota bacterium]|nr:AAA family ATPase [Actinomycetota bacterium]